MTPSLELLSCGIGSHRQSRPVPLVNLRDAACRRAQVPLKKYWLFISRRVWLLRCQVRTYANPPPAQNGTASAGQPDIARHSRCSAFLPKRHVIETAFQLNDVHFT